MKKGLIALALAGALSLAAAVPMFASQGSGCLPTTGTVSGLSMTQNINSAIAALTSMFSGGSPPSTDCSAAPVKGQQWLDTSVTPNAVKQFDGTSWVTIGALDSANHVWSPPVGGGSAALTAASTTDICAAPAALQTISGTTTITSFGSGCPIGVRKTLVFNSATPIAFNAVSMILPAQRNYVATAGDMAEAIHLGSGNWRVRVDKIDGGSVANPAVALGTVQYGDYGTPPPKTVYGAGQAISRAAYPDYFTAVSRVQTGTLTAVSNTITSVANTGGLGPGMPIEGADIQSGTVIVSVTSSTIVMSKNAVGSGSQLITVVIPGYGQGGDSTTVGVRDCQGRVLAGREGVFGSSTGRLTSTYFGANSAVIGAAGGVERADLINDNLPPFTPSGTFSGFTSRRVVSTAVGGGESIVGVTTAGGSAGATSDAANTTLGQVAVSGNVTMNPLGGTSKPFRTVQPTGIAECVVVVLL